MEAEGGELHVTLVDGSMTKAFNEGPDYPMGDALIKGTTTALSDEGLKVFRIGGDEFAIPHRGDPKMQPAVEAAVTRLRGAVASVKHKDGTKLTVSGMTFAFGTGKSTDAETAKGNASVELSKHKKRLEAEGIDRTADPLAIPPGVSIRAEGDVPTGRDSGRVGDGDTPAEGVAPDTPKTFYQLPPYATNTDLQLVDAKNEIGVSSDPALSSRPKSIKNLDRLR